MATGNITSAAMSGASIRWQHQTAAPPQSWYASEGDGNSKLYQKDTNVILKRFIYKKNLKIKALKIFNSFIFAFLLNIS